MPTGQNGGGVVAACPSWNKSVAELRETGRPRDHEGHGEFVATIKLGNSTAEFGVSDEAQRARAQQLVKGHPLSSGGRPG